MEDSNDRNQDRSELDLSCCFSSKFILPSSLLEDDDELENQNYEISLKRNLNPQKKYSSSTSISAVSNSSSQVLNRNLERSNIMNNDVLYLNHNNQNQFETQYFNGNIMRNDLMNSNSLRASNNLGGFQGFNPKGLQKKNTMSYLENKQSELMDRNYENFNQNFHSPQIYPTNLQEIINNNITTNKMNNLNMNFSNYFRNNSIKNDNNDEFNPNRGGVKMNLMNNNNSINSINTSNSPHTQFGFRKNPEDTLDIFHFNRNYVTIQNHISRRINQPINHSIIQNSLKNNFSPNFDNMTNNSFGQDVLCNYSSAKKNVDYEFVQEMSKLNIINAGKKSDITVNIRRNQQANLAHQLPPFVKNSQFSNSKVHLEDINKNTDLPKSLTPAFPPRKISNQDAVFKRTDRRLKSHTQKNKIIFDTILEEPTENETPSHEFSLNNYLKSIDGNFITFLKTQKGSRSMQKFMKNCKLTSDCVETLFMKIFPNAKEMMTDNYGNYFMQKLIQLCSGSQKMLLLKQVR